MKRSSERKKTAEENRGKTDKKAQAMDLLKAKRQAKIDRGKLVSKILTENLNFGSLQRRKKRHGKSRKVKEKKPTKKARKTKMTLKSHTPN